MIFYCSNCSNLLSLFNNDFLHVETVEEQRKGTEKGSPGRAIVRAKLEEPCWWSVFSMEASVLHLIKPTAETAAFRFWMKKGGFIVSIFRIWL